MRAPACAHMSLLGRTRSLLILASLLIGAAVWVSSTSQRGVADRARGVQAHAQQLLTSMLDQQTGVRGFLITGREEFLDPYRRGIVDYDRALDLLRGEFPRGHARDQVEAADNAAETWQSGTDDVIAAVRQRGPRNAESVAGLVARKQLFDGFRRRVGELQATLELERVSGARTASLVAAGVSLLLALLIGSLGALVIGRQVKDARRRRGVEHSYRESQTEFIETMQLAESESEAHDLLRRHIERTMPESQVVVLNRNNSADRLEPSTRVDDASSPSASRAPLPSPAWRFGWAARATATAARIR